MNPNYLQLLLILVYLLSGTLSIVLLVGWALKQFGHPKNRTSQPGIHGPKNDPKRPCSLRQCRSTNHVTGRK
jgi:hypothetical protein